MQRFRIFLSTPSARRATAVLQAPERTWMISIHALCEEGDLTYPPLVSNEKYFYPRPLRGGRRMALPSSSYSVGISIHALCEEGDSVQPGPAAQCRYFYPRPLRGGRRFVFGLRVTPTLFLSTPSARRATCPSWAAGRAPKNFYPRPLRGGRPGYPAFRPDAGGFLSTPSARRATQQTPYVGYPYYISIHALCEEGDAATAA